MEVMPRWGSFLVAAMAVWISLFSQWRGGSWRNQDEDAAVKARLQAVETDSKSVKDRLPDLATKSELKALADHIETRLEQTPSKADFAGLEARLTSEVTSLRRDVENVGGGVKRIESFLIEKGSK